MSAFLEAISSDDLGIFVNGEDFIGVQSHTERYQQSVTYRRAYGSSNPIIRTVQSADENNVGFSFVLLKNGVVRGLNTYTTFRAMRDFELQTVKGSLYETFQGCNWTDINISASTTDCTVDVQVSVPGFVS